VNVGLNYIGCDVTPLAERVAVAVVERAAHRDARSCAVLRHVYVGIVGPCLIRAAGVVHARAADGSRQVAMGDGISFCAKKLQHPMTDPFGLPLRAVNQLLPIPAINHMVNGPRILNI